MWIDNIRNKAAGFSKHILLPEGYDSRIVDAAHMIKDLGIAEVTVMRETPVSGINTIKPGDILLKESALLVSSGEFDGMVAGAVHSTADVIRAALKNIGVSRELSVISSFFLMESETFDGGEQGAFLFADCAVVPDPEPGKLADIAYSTALSARKILGWEPRVAFLSFSTKGSAKHKSVEKVVQAVEILKAREPDFVFEGEMQLDNAIIPAIAEKKDPEGILKGRANILIFPDLNSANIGYKLAQRIGKMRAVGPILQGFNKPVNDLSRGCSSEDIVDVAAFTVMQSVV